MQACRHVYRTATSVRKACKSLPSSPPLACSTLRACCCQPHRGGGGGGGSTSAQETALDGAVALAVQLRLEHLRRAGRAGRGGRLHVHMPPRLAQGHRAGRAGSAGAHLAVGPGAQAVQGPVLEPVQLEPAGVQLPGEPCSRCLVRPARAGELVRRCCRAGRPCKGRSVRAALSAGAAQPRRGQVGAHRLASRLLCSDAGGLKSSAALTMPLRLPERAFRACASGRVKRRPVSMGVLAPARAPLGGRAARRRCGPGASSPALGATVPAVAA